MPSIALMLADTEAYVLANNAVNACTARLNFDAVSIFSDQPELWSKYSHINIPRMVSIEDYNQLVLSRFPSELNSDFCLIAQYDGFIIDATRFDDRFFSCDYIGAVWPDYPYHRVGNGGFSLRSTRLTRAVADLAHLRPAGQAEDLFICRTLRPLLEDRFGCVFASEELAGRFSYEIVTDGESAFGFHGVFNLPLVYRDNLEYLIANLPERILVGRLPLLRYGASKLGAAALARLDHLIQLRSRI